MPRLASGREAAIAPITTNAVVLQTYQGPTAPSLVEWQVSQVLGHPRDELHDETEKRAAYFGLKLDQTCVCPLHGDCVGVVATRCRPGYEVSFWEWVCPAGRYGMAELRAAAAGRALPISKAEIHRWRQRLDYDTGIFRPDGIAEIQVLIPLSVSDVCRGVLEAIVLMLALRYHCHGYIWTEPFAWSKRFAAAYTGLPERAARAGFAEAQCRRLVLPTGHRGRTPLWTLDLPTTEDQ